MKIGVCKKCISTTLPIHLTGFGNPDRKFTGIHDDIFTSAIAFESNGTFAIIVTADVLGFDAAKAKNCAKLISEKTKVPADSILFNASHTHSAPQTSENVNPGIGAYLKEYADFFYDSAVKAAVGAFEDLEQGELSYTTGECYGIGINRRNIETGTYYFAPYEKGIRNDEVTLLKAVCKGKLKALFFQYTCHPSTTGFDEISGDYPAAAKRHLESAFPGTTALFLQGCCGNIRVRTINDAGNGFRGGTYEDVEHFGKLLANKVIELESMPGNSVSGKLISKKTNFKIQYQSLLPKDEYKKKADEQTLELYKNPLMKYYTEYETISPDVGYSVQRIDIGDSFTLFGLEGEVCVEYDYAIKAMLPGRHTIVAGYSNGTPGYICTADMYDYGGYEPSGSCCCYYAREGFKPETEQLILSEIKENLL
ncbi:MAG: neutral/alkaline non-lysosomal ceramidase N-terminal domain-containing protein [Oscillospiraceae bacterium]|nr:neutral/alkaline non-lysosomal ceramidase N-terminal domain-containing protein [Oscillospiraceae bacterium]